MKKTITVKSREVFREGISAGGKAWELLEIQDMEGAHYKTFVNLHEGMTYDVEVVEEISEKMNPKTGQPYVNLKISKIVPKKAQVVRSPEIENLWQEIRQINVRVQMLENKGQQIDITHPF